ncbi:S1C family serine protease [Novosphingobium sp. B-7]|uniref:S1C family serine protease n=1 Tax=Novosphingobium sp. B-7 TaxID=1298855 RepID=UPI0003B3D71C|nr:serine protease [Novosphingobium sp. B-7]
MNDLQPGQRFSLPEGQGISVRFDGRDASRLAVAAITPQGQAIAFDQIDHGQWALQSLHRIGKQADIIVYITDDTQGGFASYAYPASLQIGSDHYRLPAPSEQLAAVIIGEIYTRDGTLRIKVSNEGYTFGIDAYIRARNFTSISIPHRKRRNAEQTPPLGPDHHDSRPSGSTIGTGSGVIVGSNLIVTNAHVIEGGTSFFLSRTRTFVTALAVDELHDLALLQGNVQGEPLPLRLAAPLWLGESIMASGFPLMDLLGGDLKVTTGNVSGLTGGMGDVSRFQFTAPIGSGSSGGAIIDEAGNVVGITSASLAHRDVRKRGSISENVNFGVKASLVYELIAAAGMPLPDITVLHDANRRSVVNRLRDSVVSITVLA